MKNNKINKFILLAGLLTINSNANSFYQCVPKKEWVENILKSSSFVNVKYKEYDLVKDRKILENLSGINIIEHKHFYLCHKLLYQKLLLNYFVYCDNKRSDDIDIITSYSDVDDDKCENCKIKVYKLNF